MNRRTTHLISISDWSRQPKCVRTKIEWIDAKFIHDFRNLRLYRRIYVCGRGQSRMLRFGSRIWSLSILLNTIIHYYLFQKTTLIPSFFVKILIFQILLPFFYSVYLELPCRNTSGTYPKKKETQWKWKPGLNFKTTKLQVRYG